MDNDAIFRTIVEDQIEGIAFLDDKAVFIYANRTAEKLFETAQGELVGRCLNDFVDDKGLEPFYNSLNICKEKGSGKFLLKINTIRDTKKLLTIAAKVHGDDPSGGISIIFSDVSDQKRIEEEVKMVATATRNANDCIFITDMEDKILYANPSFYSKYLYQPEDIIGKSGSSLRSSSNQPEILSEMLQATMEGGWKGQLLSIKKDGTEFPINLSTSIVRDDDKEAIAVISIARDITHEMKIDEELIKVQELEMIGYLARGIAHNFNNILTAIVGYISLAQLTKNNEIKLTTNLAEAEKACSRARDLTQQLLGFSKGSGSLRRAASIKELIIDSASFGVAGTNVECQFKIDKNLSTVEVDEGQISQVINNIVLNAVQAYPGEGTITITAGNTTVKKRDDKAVRPGDYITISIKDEGEGIKKEVQSKIFNPFFTTKNNHSGLGLPISFSIVKKHDGCIEVDSDEGKGTTFTIYLPVTSKKAENSQSRKIQTKPGGGRRILIMDDERDVRTILGSFLESYGYQVDYAIDGDEALNIFQDVYGKHKDNHEYKKHDMVILNLTIPAGRGAKDIIDDFRKTDPGVFSVVSTGYSRDEITTDFQDRGFQAVLIKPFDSNNLNYILHQLEEHISS